MNHKTIFFFLLIFSQVGLLLAQNPDGDNGLDIDPEEIDIVKPFEPTLADAVKVEFSPDLPSPEEIKQNQPTFGNYQVPNRFLTIAYQPPTLKPLAYESEKNGKKDGEDLHNAWIRAGFGTQSTPILDIALSSGKSDKYVIGANGGYISSKGKLDFQDYSRTKVGVYGKVFTNDAFFGGNINFNRNVFYQYGYDQTDTTLVFTEDEVKQQYNKISVRGEMGNTAETRSEMDYHAEVGFHNYQNKNFNVTENNFIVKGNAERPLNSDWFVGGDAFLHFNNVTDTDTSNVGNVVLNLLPKITYKSSFGTFTGGVNLGFDDNNISPFPYLNLEARLVPDRLTLYGGWQKQVLKNSYMSITEDNPFVMPFFSLQNSEKEDRYIGAKGAVNGISFNARVGQEITDMQPLYVNDAVDGKTFQVIFEPEMKTIHPQVEIAYQLGEKLLTSLVFNAYSYTLQEEVEAWHLPSARIDLRAEFKMIENLDLMGELFVINGMKGKLVDGTAQDLKNYMDLNFAAKYKLFENLSVFANLNNALGIKAERYLNYPTYGLNLLGGAILRF
ncbi:MAG: TonB-dependent receptor [Chitinophagales bacterium]